MKDVKPITGISAISLEGLNIRYIPMAKLERWYGKDMSLKNSPHVELLKYYQENGFNWDVMLKGRYAEERRARRLEFKQEKWSEEWIKAHIKIRVAIYESLKKNGFKPEGKPIQILKKPFWNTRFGLEIFGKEIWNGAGRCSAAFVLGWKEIPAMYVKDILPGTKKCESIERKYR